jgi:hypothetical protein
MSPKMPVVTPKARKATIKVRIKTDPLFLLIYSKMK